MIKVLMNALDYGVFAELSLAIFVLVFVAIVVRTLSTQSATTTHRKGNPILCFGETATP